MLTSSLICFLLVLLWHFFFSLHSFIWLGFARINRQSNNSWWSKNEYSTSCNIQVNSEKELSIRLRPALYVISQNRQNRDRSGGVFSPLVAYFMLSHFWSSHIGPRTGASILCCHLPNEFLSTEKNCSWKSVLFWNTCIWIEGFVNIQLFFFHILKWFLSAMLFETANLLNTFFFCFNLFASAKRHSAMR